MNESTDMRQRTADANGRYWGARPRDWAELQEVSFRPLYSAAFDRVALGAGAQYLDIGCGAGLALQMAAARGAEVAGVDAADGLLSIARERTSRADLHLGDLEELPFADASFDLVTGFNSFQYAGNPLYALSEAARVVRPNGQILIATWGDPATMDAASFVKALGPLLPPPPPGAPGPFALSDELALREFAVRAGLEPLEVFDVECTFEFDSETTAYRGLSASGVAARAIEHSGADTVRRAHATAIGPFRQPDGSFRLGASFRCLMARSG